MQKCSFGHIEAGLEDKVSTNNRTLCSYETRLREDNLVIVLRQRPLPGVVPSFRKPAYIWDPITHSMP